MQKAGLYIDKTTTKARLNGTIFEHCREIV